jgi:hypothetical protein
VAAELYWDAIHNRNALLDLPADTRPIQQYIRQLHHLTHEIEHIFGAGYGEYYNLGFINDNTGILPALMLRYSTPGPGIDPYWGRHRDFWRDPFLDGLPLATYHEFTNYVRFADVTAAIINGAYRGKLESTLPDLSRTEFRILDEKPASLSPSHASKPGRWTPKTSSGRFSTMMV